MMITLVAQVIESDAVRDLTIGGWITMILSVGFVTGLLVWCIVKVMREPDAEHRLHSSLDETPDTRKS